MWLVSWLHPLSPVVRTGRGLIQLVLRRRGLASRIVPPVSLVLATWAKDYFQGLTATRYLVPYQTTFAL